MISPNYVPQPESLDGVLRSLSFWLLDELKYLDSEAKIAIYHLSPPSPDKEGSPPNWRMIQLIFLQLKKGPNNPTKGKIHSLTKEFLSHLRNSFRLLPNPLDLLVTTLAPSLNPNRPNHLFLLDPTNDPPLPPLPPILNQSVTTLI